MEESAVEIVIKPYESLSCEDLEVRGFFEAGCVIISDQSCNEFQMRVDEVYVVETVVDVMCYVGLFYDVCFAQLSIQILQP